MKFLFYLLVVSFLVGMEKINFAFATKLPDKEMATSFYKLKDVFDKMKDKFSDLNNRKEPMNYFPPEIDFEDQFNPNINTPKKRAENCNSVGINEPYEVKKKKKKI